MARTLTNISDLPNSLPVENIKVLSFTEEIEKIDRIKYSLSLFYFAGIIIFGVSLIL